MTAKSVSHVPNQKFFVTTPLKVTLLSLFTLGLYELYWMYKNWRLVYADEHKFVSFLRAFFGSIFVFPLLKGLGIADYKKLGVIYLLICLLGFLPGNFMLLSTFSFVIVAVVQNQLNKRLDAKVSAPFSIKAIFFSIVGILLTILLFVAGTGVDKETQQNSMQNSSHHTVAKTQDKDGQQTAETQAVADQPKESSTTEQTATPTPKTTTPMPKTVTPATTKTVAPQPTTQKNEVLPQNGAPLILSTSTLNISLSSFNRLPVTITSPDGLPMPMPTGAYNNTPFVFGWDASDGSRPPAKAASWTLVFDANWNIAVGTYIYHFSAGTSTDNWQTVSMHKADLTVVITQ